MAYLKNTKTRVIVFLLVVILVPIAWNQYKSYLAGEAQKKAMAAPRAVQIMNPVVQDIYTQTESSGRIEAKYSFYTNEKEYQKRRRYGVYKAGG